MLSKEIREGSTPLNKTRYTFLYLENTMEIDVYPGWKRTAIMETEMDGYDKEVALPPFIKIVKRLRETRLTQTRRWQLNFLMNYKIL